MEYFSFWDEKYRLADYNVNIFIGIRGAGKTYSAIRGMDENLYNGRMMLSRLTKDEVEILCSESGNMFKKYNQKNGKNYAFFPMKGDLYQIHPSRVEGLKRVVDGECLGYCCPLHTLSKICGIGMEDVTAFVIDEFIRPEDHTRRKGFKICTCWETINRNREDEGMPPCKLILLSNSNDIYDDVFVFWDLVEICENMVYNGEHDYYDDDRSIALHLIEVSESFKEFKQQSAVARATKGTEFYAMAYENVFASNDFAYVQKKGTQKARPVCSINGRAYIYQLDNGLYHVTYRRSAVIDYPIKNRAFQLAFRREFGFLERMYSAGQVTFQSYELKAIFLRAIL